MDLDKLATQLIKHEGLKLKPYVDTVGKLTIGVGHNLTDKGLTKPQVMAILKDDIQDVVDFLDHALPWWKDLNDVRQRALADLTFNMGPKILEFKATLGALEGRQWNAAASHLLDSLYAKQVGARAIEIAHMIFSGEDSP